jgi:carbonic anhydrase
VPTDEYSRLLAENERYAESFDLGRLGPTPLAGLLILTCMDARMVLADIFGLRPGDANVLRNAGAVATDDVIRSIVLSQRVLGTREVIVLGHTGCGLHRLREDKLRAEVALQAGVPAQLSFGAFEDLDDHVRRQVARLRADPLVLDVPIHGLVYEVETGRVRPVSEAAGGAPPG